MTAPARTGVTESRRRLAERAQALRGEGKLLREIAVELGVSRSYASALAGEDPLGAKSRVRKDGYRGECEECGGPTDGSNGLSGVPALCWECSHAAQSADKMWTRENVVDAIQRFAAANGRPPRASEWVRSDPVNGYPTRTSVYQAGRRTTSPFVHWADAIEASGFPRPVTGHYERQPKAVLRKTKYQGRGVTMRDYVVLEQQEDGSWSSHPGINAYSEALAVEAYAQASGAANGRLAHSFVAVAAHRWVIRELQPVTTFKAVVADTAKA